MEIDKIYLGDSLNVLKSLDDNSIDCCVTSPPYYAQRDYGVDGQIGLEQTPEEYIKRLTEVFMEVYRVLKPQGTMWLNIGDSYWGGGWRGAEFNEHSGDVQKGSKGTHSGSSMPPLKGKNSVYKPKDLIGIPWLMAFSLRNQGWYLRQDIIWQKDCCMPESVTDRCTKSHEYIFLMSKSQRYYFDHEAIQEPCADQRRTNYTAGSRSCGLNEDRNDNDLGERSKIWKPRVKQQADGDKQQTLYVRNKRSVWNVNPKPIREAHFATFPEELVSPCILAGCPQGGIVLDPFFGSGTTGIVANKLGRHYVGIELNPEYIKIAEKRLGKYKSQYRLF